MVNMAAPTLTKELLLGIEYHEDGQYHFYTKNCDFFAASDDAYPYCPNLPTTLPQPK